MSRIPLLKPTFSAYHQEAPRLTPPRRGPQVLVFVVFVGLVLLIATHFNQLSGALLHGGGGFPGNVTHSEESARIKRLAMALRNGASLGSMQGLHEKTIEDLVLLLDKLV